MEPDSEVNLTSFNDIVQYEADLIENKNHHEEIGKTFDFFDINKLVADLYQTEVHNQELEKFNNVQETEIDVGNEADNEEHRPSSRAEISEANTNYDDDLEASNEMNKIQIEEESDINYSFISSTEECDSDITQLNDCSPKIAAWRYGPAQYWYDMLNVPESGEGFDYGFKLKDKMKSDEVVVKGEPINDEAYLLMNQLHWEDDVIWDADDVKEEVMRNLKSNTNGSEWSAYIRSSEYDLSPTRNVKSHLHGTIVSPKQQIPMEKQEQNEIFYSLFNPENEDLIYGKWEDEVIWDAEAMDKIPEPKLWTLDPNDETIILGIPDDIYPTNVDGKNAHPPERKYKNPFSSKSKISISKNGLVSVIDESTPLPPLRSPEMDPFNISDDNYYLPNISKYRSKFNDWIKHPTSVTELRPPYIPTHMGPNSLKAFHRPTLKKISNGPLATPGPHPVLPIVKRIEERTTKKGLPKMGSGSENVFFTRNMEDLSAKDGDIILLEFCEEYPSLINQVGMCSIMKNYYKKTSANDLGPLNLKYGSTTFVQKSPFLGKLRPGECIQAMKNNMYCAPIYPHNLNSTDFLVLKTQNNFFIREINAIYTVGKICPLLEVPRPNSLAEKKFIKDFLQVFIYRLFLKCENHLKRIKIEDIKSAFPDLAESCIRKRLRHCSEFKRTGVDSNYWVLKPHLHIPSEEEIRDIVSPEKCCAFFSMKAAEQRFKDAGYGKKYLREENEADEEVQLESDDEVEEAPWNTTKAYIDAMHGKCLLKLTDPTDPINFSYVRLSNKTPSMNERNHLPRKVLGTDADLRRLSLTKAKEILKKLNVPSTKINQLSRWDIIHAVRELSTKKFEAGEQDMKKFSRRVRLSLAQQKEKYKDDCQALFDLQNKVLSNSEIVPTDNDEISVTDEEKSQAKNAQNSKHQILKIIRTFIDKNGHEYTCVEIVRDQKVLHLYNRIRKRKDQSFIRKFINSDEKSNTTLKRRKPCTQDIKSVKKHKKLEKKSSEAMPILDDSESTSLIVPELSNDLSTSKTAKRIKIDPNTLFSAILEQILNEMEALPDAELFMHAVNPEIVKNYHNIIKNPMNLEMIRKNLHQNKYQSCKEFLADFDLIVENSSLFNGVSSFLTAAASRISQTCVKRLSEMAEKLTELEEAISLVSNNENQVALSMMFEELIDERLKPMLEIGTTIKPNNKVQDLDYSNAFENPMDLEIVSKKVSAHKYHSCAEFISDIKLMVKNYQQYYGNKSNLTHNAKNVLEYAKNALNEFKDHCALLEKKIAAIQKKTFPEFQVNGKVLKRPRGRPKISANKQALFEDFPLSRMQDNNSEYA